MEYNASQRHAIERFEYHEQRFADAQNNRQYITALRGMLRWLEEFSNLLNAQERLASAEYEAYFFTGCGFSVFDRIQISIADYEYGNHPF